MMMRASLCSFTFVIPPIDRIADHPSDPIARQAAIARSAGQGRPHGRRSLALDRSEHGGRLTALGRDSLRSPRYPLCRRIMQVGAICIVLALSRGLAAAEPETRPRPGSTFAERFDATDPWTTAITEASRRFGVPETWIRAIMRVESHGDVRAVSPKGAMGLMQIMPATWTDLRARYHLGDDPFDAHDNILAGAAFLRELYDRYGAPGFLAAYQAGPGRYEDHLTTGRALPADTRVYVTALAPVIDGVSDNDQAAVADPLAWTRAPLFTVSHANASAVSPPQPGRGESDHTAVEVSALAPQSDGLFAPVGTPGRGP